MLTVNLHFLLTYAQ